MLGEHVHVHFVVLDELASDLGSAAKCSELLHVYRNGSYSVDTKSYMYMYERLCLKGSVTFCTILGINLWITRASHPAVSARSEWNSNV